MSGSNRSCLYCDHNSLPCDGQNPCSTCAFIPRPCVPIGSVPDFRFTAGDTSTTAGSNTTYARTITAGGASTSLAGRNNAALQDIFASARATRRAEMISLNPPSNPTFRSSADMPPQTNAPSNPTFRSSADMPPQTNAPSNPTFRSSADMLPWIELSIDARLKLEAYYSQTALPNDAQMSLIAPDVGVLMSEVAKCFEAR
jgi:hypothetical protein